MGEKVETNIEEANFMKEIENMANINENGKDFERLEASDIDSDLITVRNL